MSDDKLAASAKAAWQAQHVEVPSMSYLRLRAMEHSEYGRNRSLLEYGAAGVGLAAAVAVFIAIDSLLLRAGLAVAVAGSLYWLHVLRRNRLTWDDSSRGAAEDALSFYRRELARLRDVHRGLWKAHVLASAPGAVLLSAWVLLESEAALFSERWWQAAAIPVAVAAWIGSMIWHEAQRARAYHRELEALEQRAE